MGRPRKPTRLKIMSGTARPCRLNPNEPMPEPATPDPPESLSERARELWHRYAEILGGMQVLSFADGSALEQLCECHALVLDLREQLKKLRGTIYVTETETGQKMLRGYPQMAQLADAERRLYAWLGAFGLTPASRSKVSKAVEKPGPSKFDKVLAPIPIRKT